MARRPCWNHSLVLKAKVPVAAINGEKNIIELAQEFDVHPNQIKQRRDQLFEGAIGAFGHPPNRVWAMDITYMPMTWDFIYHAAVMD